MRNSSLAAVVMALSVLFFNASGQAASPNAQDGGVRYCPAPWCDNSEFIDTHFGIDAKTGKVTKYTGTVHPDETGDLAGAGDQVLYVAPPLSVENRYVPHHGAAPQTPPPHLLLPPQQPEPCSLQPMPTARNVSRLYSAAPQAGDAPPLYNSQNAGVRRQTAMPAGQKKTRGEKLPWWKAITQN